MGDPAKVMTFHRDHGAKLVLVSLDGSPCPAQVTQTFFANIGNGDDVRSGFDFEPVKNLKRGNHRCHPKTVVANRGTMQLVTHAHNVQFRVGGKDRISVGEQHQGATASVSASSVHVSNLVDLSRITPLFE